MSPTNWARLAVVVCVGLIFQVAILNEIVVFGAHPDVMILIVAASGIVAGPGRGAIVGFITGLVADLVVVTPYGLGALCFVLVGFSVGLVRSLSSEGEIDAPKTTVCIVAAALGTLLYALLGSLVGQSGMFEAAPAAIFVVTLGACVLSYPVLRVVRWALTGTVRSRSTLAVPRGGSAAG
jgi:rod shape-determining protein MreD